MSDKEGKDVAPTPVVVVEDEGSKSWLSRMWRRGMDTPCGKETLQYSVGGLLIPWLVVYGGTGKSSLANKFAFLGFTLAGFGYLIPCSIRTEEKRRTQKRVKEMMEERKFGDIPTPRPTGS